MPLSRHYYKFMEFLTLLASHNIFDHYDGYIVIFDGCLMKIILHTN